MMSLVSWFLRVGDPSETWRALCIVSSCMDAKLGIPIEGGYGHLLSWHQRRQLAAAAVLPSGADLMLKIY